MGGRELAVLAGAAAMLVRVVAPHFCAALVCNDEGVCIEAAPILRWAVGKHRRFLSSYFRMKGWKASVVSKATGTTRSE